MGKWGGSGPRRLWRATVPPSGRNRDYRWGVFFWLGTEELGSDCSGGKTLTTREINAASHGKASPSRLLGSLFVQHFAGSH